MTQPVLFIGGMGRSGSTLVERMLNEFPQAFAVGETVHIWERGVRDNELCGCGDPFHHCEFWTEVGRRAFGSWAEIDTERVINQRWDVDRSRRLPQMMQAHRSGNPTRSQRDYLELIGALLTAAGAVAKDRTGADLIIDSSKHLSSAVLYALDDRLDVRVVHVIRDPRGVAYSYTKSVERPEATDGTETEMARYSPARTAGRWVTDNLGFTQLPRLGIPTIRIRYEDFMAEPLTVLADIASFSGIDQAALPDSVFDRTTAVLETPMHSAAGNPMRFGSRSVTLRLDDDWRRDMPADQRRLVSGMTAGTRRLFGY